MKKLLALILVLSSVQAAQAHYWFATNVMTSVESISPQETKLKITELEDDNKHCFPVGTVVTLKNNSWSAKKGLKDEQINTSLVSATLPSGKVFPLSGKLVIKPRSTTKRVLMTVFGLFPQGNHIEAGDSIIIFDTQDGYDTSLTAIEDSTL